MADLKNAVNVAVPSASDKRNSRHQSKLNNVHDYEEISRAHTMEELLENWNLAIKNNRLDEFFQKEHQVNLSF